MLVSASSVASVLVSALSAALLMPLAGSRAATGSQAEGGVVR
jgi:hypothetical protein